MKLQEFHEQCAQADLRHKKEVRRAVISILAVAAIAVVLFQFVCGVAIVRGDSMLPGLKDGALVLYLKQPGIRRGDIAILHDTDGSVIIKRVIGTAGDTVGVDEYGMCMINGFPLSEPYAKYPRFPTSAGVSVTVEPGRIFVMGDNREKSVDSRMHGTISSDEVKGKVILLFECL